MALLDFSNDEIDSQKNYARLHEYLIVSRQLALTANFNLYDKVKRPFHNFQYEHGVFYKILLQIFLTVSEIKALGKPSLDTE